MEWIQYGDSDCLFVSSGVLYDVVMTMPEKMATTAAAATELMVVMATNTMTTILTDFGVWSTELTEKQNQTDQPTDPIWVLQKKKEEEKKHARTSYAIDGIKCS